MTISLEEVEKVADLARIGISDGQAEQLKSDMSHILEMVAKINSVDTENTQPLAHPFDATQPLRQDYITETNQRDAFQKLAPNVHSGLYIVPAVIESE